LQNISVSRRYLLSTPLKDDSLHSHAQRFLCHAHVKNKNNTTATAENIKLCDTASLEINTIAACEKQVSLLYFVKICLISDRKISYE